MPARDTYHDLVSRLLVAEGWRITHDPYHIGVGHKNLFVDLGAEKIIAAERQGKRIAVEVKSFQGSSEVHDLELALGQYMLYDPFVRAQDADRVLYLALPSDAFDDLFEEPIGKGLLDAYDLRLLVFHPISECIVKWIPTP